MNSNSKGSALIGVIVAATITSVIGLAMASLISSQTNSVVLLEDKLEKLQLSRVMEDLITDGLSCGNTLNGLNVGAVGSKANVASIKDSSNVLFIGSNSDSGFLKIGQISFLNKSISTTNSTGVIELTVPINRKRHSSGMKVLKSIQIPINATVDAASKITSCGSAAGSPGTVSSNTCVNSMVNGVKFCSIGPVANYKFCFLTGVYASTSSNDLGGMACKVLQVGSDYVLEAIAENANNTVRCYSKCLSN